MKKPHTEDEITSNNSMQIHYFAKLLETQPETFNQIADHLPFVICQSDRETLNWIWGNEFGLSFFEAEQGNLPELSQLSKNANKNVFNHNISKIRTFDSINDQGGMCAYYQLYTYKGKEQWLATGKTITSENNFFSISYFLDDFVGVGSYIQNVLDTTLSDINAWKSFQSLTKKEKNILQLFASGKSSKEISTLLCLSEHTVRTHRKNIYYKINVKNFHGLLKFAEAFKLISAF